MLYFAAQCRHNVAGENNHTGAPNFFHRDERGPQFGEQRITLLWIAKAVLQSCGCIERNAKLLALRIRAIEVIL